ncbi:CBO0543 family protein [Paenibacillus silviterrae]|uniref:CBO0543 family protein n=1 Tax=Paenibacillus silviterrae TaxID=3242194 RepID=UPI00350E5674
MYLPERIILGSVWSVVLISVWFVPRRLIRQASFIFFFAQLPAWILGLLVVEFGWIEYPVRELHKVNATSFTFEYLILPIISIFFNLYFPSESSLSKKLLYYTSILAVFTLVEFFIEKYTLLINYLHWEWYYTFISMGIIFYLVRSIYKWFFRLGKPLSL